jgi:glycosyltransferase involved in cell wall biosynthesis
VSAAPELVLLSAEYPFGDRSEPFLEAEMEVLAERFRRIYLLPSHRREGMRAVPGNAEIVEMDWLEEPTRRAKQRALASPEAARVLLWTLRTPADVRPYLVSREYIDILAKNILKLGSLRRFVRERGLGSAVFYDYWFENSTLALALLRRCGAIRTAVSRAHRFDIYDEAWEGRAVPFRSAKAQRLDAVFPVSDFGRAYLEEHVPALRGKTWVERLGVRDPGQTCPERTAATPLVVTCARLLPRKRVHLVPEVLASLDRPVRWVHLGDGPERRRVEAAASCLDRNVTWRLAGQLPHREVLEFYETHHVDALLSLSLSEGLPVSMMEAQSYGVPIVACAVHGVPEIVNDSTGVLVAPEATLPDVAAALRRALEPDTFYAAPVRKFFLNHFEASANYNRFADALIALHKRQGTAKLYVPG